MSYDIYALHVDPGAATSFALEETIRRDDLAEGAARDPAKDARKRSIAGALATAGLGYHVAEHDYAELAAAEGVTEDEARRQVRHIRVDNGTLQVEIGEEYAAVKVPYASKLVNSDVADEVFATLRALRAEARLVPYDPQLGRELDIESDGGAFLESFGRGVEEACSRGAEESVADHARASWWKRLLRIG